MPKRILILLSTLLIMGASGYLGLGYLGAKRAEPAIKIALSEWRDVATISYDKMSWKPLSQRVSLKKVSVKLRGDNEPFATIKNLALKMKYVDQQLVSMEAILEGVKIIPKVDYQTSGVSLAEILRVANEKNKIVVNYAFFPGMQQASLSIKAVSKKLGKFNAAMEVDNFSPSVDVVFDYPNIVLRKATVLYQDKGLTKQLKNTFNIYLPNYFSAHFAPQKTLTVAEMINTSIDSLLADKSLKIATESESFSISGWIESYFVKLKEELGAAELSTKNSTSS